MNRAKISCSLAACMAVAVFTLGLLPSESQAKTLLVGSGRTYSTIRAAAQAANPGDTVFVDSGTYTGDVCSWTRPNVTVVGATPRPVLIANGSIENDKGVWLVTTSATGFTADNFEISGAVSSGFNGAAIRVDNGNPGWVAIRNCYFHDNQMNILAAPDSLMVERCELAHTTGGFNTSTGLDGNQHNIYVNTSSCRVVVFRYNYSHDSWVGHPFKSRARNTYVLYNRLEDGSRPYECTAGGCGYKTAAYTIDIPDGGRAYIIGNVIVQGATSPNTTIVSYAAESAGNGTLDIYAINNTIVNEASSGTFINVRSGTTCTYRNNILYGPGTSWGGGSVTESNNYVESSRNNGAGFLNPSGEDYHLTSATPLAILNAGVLPGVSATGYNLMPTSQYVYDRQSTPRPFTGAIDLGAFEYAIGSGGTDTTPPTAIRDLRNR